MDADYTAQLIACSLKPVFGFSVNDDNLASADLGLFITCRELHRAALGEEELSLRMDVEWRPVAAWVLGYEDRERDLIAALEPHERVAEPKLLDRMD